ncbi:MAG: DUF624 domain-containing protein [Eubacteriales bacterium]|nr:DUF624 domain-containing protein [Eubacteriales bacterium]
MSSFFNPELKLWTWLRHLADLLLISLSVLLTSLSIVASGPGLAAAYTATDKLLRQDERVFFTSFRTAFKKFWQASLIISLGLFILALNYLYLWPNFLLSVNLKPSTMGSLYYAISFLSVFILTYLIWHLACLRHLAEAAERTEEFALFKGRKAFTFSLAYFFKLGLRSLLAVMIVGGGLYILAKSAFYIWPLFILPGLILYLLAALFEPVLSQLFSFEQTDGTIFHPVIPPRHE